MAMAPAASPATKYNATEGKSEAEEKRPGCL